MQEPPGGPPDFTPPTITATIPDSGAVLAGFRDPARIQFNEVVAERADGMAAFIVLDPRPDELHVDWKRDALEIKPDGGWRPNVVYHLTLLPGVTDLRTNRLDSGRTIIFSTGGPIPDTRLTGVALDWEGGRTAVGALIEATLLPDSLTYTGRSDSSGAFVLSALPRGRYHLVASVDQNNDRRRQPREPFDSTTLQLDSTASRVLWAYTQDTVGPTLATLTQLDSVFLRLEFDRSLAPDSTLPVTVRVGVLPDTTPVEIVELLRPERYDSLRAAADTTAPDSAAAADTAAAAADTIAVREPVSLPLGRGRRPAEPPAPHDSTAAEHLLATRPRLRRAVVIHLAAPLAPGGRYLVRAEATSVSGAIRESQRVLVVPAARDST